MKNRHKLAISVGISFSILLLLIFLAPDPVLNVLGAGAIGWILPDLVSKFLWGWGLESSSHDAEKAAETVES
jgi:hypothetical protein